MSTDNQQSENGHDPEVDVAFLTEEDIADKPAASGGDSGDGSSSRQPTLADVLGIAQGMGESNPLAPLFEGSTAFHEWGPRGNRTANVALAEVQITLEDATLRSPSFPIRGDQMKGIINQNAYKALFGWKVKRIKPYEVGILLAFGFFMFSIVGLIGLANA